MTSTVTVMGTLLVLFCASSMGQLAVTPQDDPDILADTILGYGITIVPGSPSFTGASAGSDPHIGSAGTFTAGADVGIGIGSGIILTTGNVLSAVGPNSADETSRILGLPGDPDLAVLVAPLSTGDATVLELQFETESGNVSFNFVFASEEYNKFVYTGVNDVFGLYVDGENIALIPGTNTFVSIDTVNGGGGHFDTVAYGVGASNPQYYNNNDTDDGGGLFNIQYNGFTSVFTAQKLGLGPGIHTLKLAIADVGDKQLDSAVFIQADSLTDEPRAESLTCNCSTPGLFAPPADRDITVKKGNRVIPLKFTLCDDNVLPVTDVADLIAEVDYEGGAGDLSFTEEDFLSAGHGDDTNLFSYVGEHWQLNLQTKMFDAAGVYLITVVSTDPDYVIDPTCSLRFEIR
jgi:hypothetical protein